MALWRSTRVQLVKTKNVGVVVLYPWGFEIGVYDSLKKLERDMKRLTGQETKVNRASYGAYVWQDNPSTGQTFFAMYIAKNADIGTVVHECQHVMDAVHEQAGLPITYENTELRAYQMGQLVRDVCGIFGFSLTRQ